MILMRKEVTLKGAALIDQDQPLLLEMKKKRDFTGWVGVDEICLFQ